MLILNYILAEWSLISGMTDNEIKEKMLRFALSHIRKAQLEKIMGSLTFNFHNGKLMTVETKTFDKPKIDSKE